MVGQRQTSSRPAIIFGQTTKKSAPEKIRRVPRTNPDSEKSCATITFFNAAPRQKPASFSLDEVMRKMSTPKAA